MDTFKNSYKVSDKRLVSLSVYNVGYQRCEPGYAWGPGVRDHYLIHYIISGKGTYTVAGRVYELEAGDMFVVYPDTGVAYSADKDDPWEYYWVGFSGSDAPAMVEATPASRDNPVIRGEGGRKNDTVNGENSLQNKAALQNDGADGKAVSGNNTSFAKHILKIYEARGNDYSAALRMTGELYLTLCDLIEAAEKAPTARPYDYSYVQKALDYIAMNYSYPLTVDSIADYVGISRSQLFREFKKYMNVSPKDHLTALRMRKACRLLDSTALSVTEVAYSVGYDDPLYFSRVFSHETGMAPTAYRNRKRNQ